MTGALRERVARSSLKRGTESDFNISSSDNELSMSWIGSLDLPGS